MKVSFYHLGNSWIAFKGMVKKLGLETVDPPKITRKTLEFGVKHSPESACEPFKYILGEYRDLLEAGADTIFYMESSAEEACRIPQYMTGPKTILGRLGYKFDTIAWGGKEQKELLEDFRKVSPGLTMFKFKLVQLFGIIKLHYIEWLEDFVNQLRPYAIDKEKCNELMKTGLDLIDKAQSIPNLIKAKRKIKKLARQIKSDRTRKPIPILVVGDLFRILEHEANQHIFEKLGNVGIMPYRSFYLSHYYRKGGKIGPWGKKSFKYRRKFASRYINSTMAFGTLEAVGDTVRALKKNKVKGIIHLYNFTCMPEIVNSVIFKKIAKDFDVPLLSLVSGEHETVAHQDTRIEAFVDLLKK
ncbi:hypothetical protein GF371_02930 [Candidatus Woesearchaeota archaeon]|nr:hypothetical protein [Candidatus Woesearchaeota archaeon]